MLYLKALRPGRGQDAQPQPVVRLRRRPSAEDFKRLRLERALKPLPEGDVPGGEAAAGGVGVGVNVEGGSGIVVAVVHFPVPGQLGLEAAADILPGRLRDKREGGGAFIPRAVLEAVEAQGLPVLRLGQRRDLLGLAHYLRRPGQDARGFGLAVQKCGRQLARGVKGVFRRRGLPGMADVIRLIPCVAREAEARGEADGVVPSVPRGVQAEHEGHALHLPREEDGLILRSLRVRIEARIGRVFELPVRERPGVPQRALRRREGGNQLPIPLEAPVRR